MAGGTATGADTARFIDQLKAALRHYGLDFSTAGAAEVVARYDDYPDGKLDVAEFSEIIRDIESGVLRSGAPVVGGRVLRSIDVYSPPYPQSKRRDIERSGGF